MTKDFYIQDYATSIIYGPYKFVPGMTGRDYANFLDSWAPKLVFSTGTIAFPINGWNRDVIGGDQLIEETTYHIDSNAGSTGGEPT